MPERLSRQQLRSLTDGYLKDAEILLRNRRWSSAFYLAGYAVECALKACIAKQFRKHEFPDREIVNKSYTHDLEKLLRLAGLTDELTKRTQRPDQFQRNWAFVIGRWDETKRYESSPKGAAKELFQCVSDTREGVVPWIKLHW